MRIKGAMGAVYVAFLLWGCTSAPEDAVPGASGFPALAEFTTPPPYTTPVPIDIDVDHVRRILTEEKLQTAGSVSFSIPVPGGAAKTLRFDSIRELRHDLVATGVIEGHDADQGTPAILTISGQALALSSYDVAGNRYVDIDPRPDGAHVLVITELENHPLSVSEYCAAEAVSAITSVEPGDLAPPQGIGPAPAAAETNAPVNVPIRVFYTERVRRLRGTSGSRARAQNHVAFLNASLQRSEELGKMEFFLLGTELATGFDESDIVADISDAYDGWSAILDGFADWLGWRYHPDIVGPGIISWYIHRMYSGVMNSVLLVDNPKAGSIVGIAWIGATPAIVSGAESTSIDNVVFAHEIGHNLGAVHDTQGRWIMYPSVYDDANRFGDDSIADILDVVDNPYSFPIENEVGTIPLFSVPAGGCHEDVFFVWESPDNSSISFSMSEQGNDLVDWTQTRIDSSAHPIHTVRIQTANTGLLDLELEAAFDTADKTATLSGEVDSLSGRTVSVFSTFSGAHTWDISPKADTYPEPNCNSGVFYGFDGNAPATYKVWAQ